MLFLHDSDFRWFGLGGILPVAGEDGEEAAQSMTCCAEAQKKPDCLPAFFVR
jgi:hypothetical protein